MLVAEYTTMISFDVIVVGGGITGLVVAKYTAQRGLQTLFLKKEKTPRNKPCSDIQFPYFECILGETITANRLYKIQLKNVKIALPNGKSLAS